MPVVNPPNPSTNIIISLADYLTPGVSTYQAMKRALDACKQQKAAKLIISPGRYVFDDPNVLQPPNTHVGIFGQSDLIIDGQGAEFVFRYPARIGFGFSSSERILIRNLIVDYDTLLASPGVVKKESNGKTSIRILDGYPASSSTVFAAVNRYDLKNLQWKRGDREIYAPRDVTMTAPQTFVSTDFDRFADGDEVIIRHYVYGSNAFSVGSNNLDLTFEGITVYSCPGMGFGFFSTERGFRLSNCKIMQRPGEQRFVSATADGSHFSRTLGDIIVEDCDFSGMGDDSINITGAWVTITRVNSTRMLVLGGEGAQYEIIRAGDELRFCKRKDLAEYATRKVAQVAFNQALGEHTITLDADLSGGEVSDYVGNLSRSSSRFVVRRNFFHNHRARGMMIQSRDGLIEDNRVKDVTMSGINLYADVHYFLEGPGAENLIVRGNTVEGCNYNEIGTIAAFSAQIAGINVVTDVLTGMGAYPLLKNILIERNTVIDVPGLAILIASCQGVTVRDNTVVRSNQEPFEKYRTGEGIDAKAKGSIMVTRASNVTITGNRQIITPDMFDKGIYVDSRNTSNIVVTNNSEETPSPSISQADFNGLKRMTITGSYFSSPASVIINGEDRSDFIVSTTSTEIVLKGKAKKLRLNSGDNTVQVMNSGGSASNVFVLKL